MANLEDNINKSSATDCIAGGTAGETLQSGAKKRKSQGNPSQIAKEEKSRRMYCKGYSPLQQGEYVRNHRYFQSSLTTRMLYSVLDLCANFCLTSVGDPLVVFISLRYITKKDFANLFPVSVTIQMSITLFRSCTLSVHPLLPPLLIQ